MERLDLLEEETSLLAYTQSSKECEKYAMLTVLMSHSHLICMCASPRTTCNQVLGWMQCRAFTGCCQVR